MTVEVSMAMGDHGVCHPAAVLVQVPDFIDGPVVCSYASLFCDGVTTSTWLAKCLGPSRPVRREEASLEPGNTEPNREGKKKSAWCTGPSEPDEEGKGD